MLNFLKKRAGVDFDTRKKLVERVFSLLHPKFLNISNQVQDGILTDFKILDSPFVNYTKFILKVDVLNKYENKKENFYSLNGIKVFDTNIQNYTDIRFYLGYGILLGYSTPLIKNLNPDINNINITNYWLKNFENDEFIKIKHLLTISEQKLINESDVYEINLNGKVYYHLKDLEDGDFVGMDLNKKLYSFKHDPFEINVIEKPLAEIFS